MTSRRRIYTIYRKELKDILRDRRTLIAMVVVPIVLYPLLMLGSVQAVSYQAQTVREQAFNVGVSSERDGQLLLQLLELDKQECERINAGLEEENGDENANETEKVEPPSVKVIKFSSVDDMIASIQKREIEVGFALEEGLHWDNPEQRSPIKIYRDSEEVRSAGAAYQLDNVLWRVSEAKVRDRLTELGLHVNLAKPFELNYVDLAAPSSMLGQILPLILILMTITGAIYPAIDLTAGERERGTLESLMVSPVPVLELIVGKFLVVTTVAIMGATLNLASVSATVWYGGLGNVVETGGDGLPIHTMVVILLCLVPFAVLMSAIMIAVCSYARTFKEAQNYITPVIIAVLIPGGIAAFPAAELTGPMLVVPVGNMVLLARQFLLGAPVPAWQVVTVLLSTTLYAASAIAIAASVFGRESVVFSDAGSFKSLYSRRLIKPADKPTVSMSLLVVALLFPTWFFIQTAMQPAEGESAQGLLRGTAIMMPLLFVILPLLLCAYYKVDIRQTFMLRRPPALQLLAALVIGLSMWIPAHELVVLQNSIIGVPEYLKDSQEMLEKSLSQLSWWQTLLILACVPAICEEFLFRGFLLSGLRGSAGKWTCIISTALIFGAFHFLIFKLPVTAALGVVLAIVCWQSRALLPCVLIHFLHNGLAASLAIWPTWPKYIGVSEASESGHLPWHVSAVGCTLFVLGLLVVLRANTTPHRVQS